MLKMKRKIEKEVIPQAHSCFIRSLWRLPVEVRLTAEGKVTPRGWKLLSWEQRRGPGTCPIDPHVPALSKSE